MIILEFDFKSQEDKIENSDLSSSKSKREKRGGEAVAGKKENGVFLD